MGCAVRHAKDSEGVVHMLRVSACKNVVVHFSDHKVLSSVRHQCTMDTFARLTVYPTVILLVSCIC
jgi:hypothetical protein